LAEPKREIAPVGDPLLAEQARVPLMLRYSRPPSIAPGNPQRCCPLHV